MTIDELQGLNKHHASRVEIAAIKILIIRAIITQNNKIINGRLPDSQSVFMTHISDESAVTTSEQTGGDVY